MTLTKPHYPSYMIIPQNIRWVERKDDGSIKKIHPNSPKVGFTLIIDPYLPEKTFQTEPITFIIESTDKLVHFRTIKNEYKLSLKDNYLDLLDSI